MSCPSRCLLACALWLLAVCSPAAAAPFIALQVPSAAAERAPLRLALEDVQALLERGFPGREIVVNQQGAEIEIVLPALPVHAAEEGEPLASDDTPPPSYPPCDYSWSSRRETGRLVLTLRTRSPEGAVFGLYGLLQEKLGYRFIHPRQTLYPSLKGWPLPADFSFSARPRFASRGFHLHTLHPIELTEALHGGRDGADGELREYVDWLVRNGQNVMQFYLLRTVERDSWPRQARELVAYAHRRGVRVGCMVSVSMLQQRAFQLLKVLRPEPYGRQLDRSLDWLFQVPWDFVSIDYTLGEHLPDLRVLLPHLQESLSERIGDEYGARVLTATHVIRNRRFGIDGDSQRLASLAPPGVGILVHTVMFYAVDDERAPVYGNDNLRFMAELAQRETQKRETWFWPESAYWVAFDDSVPLLLLPYLDGRWRDMRTMERIGVDGHLTFSSGWEWGYWLTDWSLARWSWEVGSDGAPLQYLEELFPDELLRRQWRAVLALQKRCLKEQGLIDLLAAADPFTEMPPPFDPVFQPRAQLSSRWILAEGTEGEVRERSAVVVRQLGAFADQLQAAAQVLDERTTELLSGGEVSLELFCVERELIRALEVTALRARHRALTLQALALRRLEGRWWRPLPASALPLLAEAASVRLQALTLVRDQEQVYRYPLALVAGRRDGHTAYHFGYLYPVHDLFFWRREEEQVKSGRWDALFLNIWPMWRTLGPEGLFL